MKACSVKRCVLVIMIAFLCLVLHNAHVLKVLQFYFMFACGRLTASVVLSHFWLLVNWICLATLWTGLSWCIYVTWP